MWIGLQSAEFPRGLRATARLGRPRAGAACGTRTLQLQCSLRE